MNSGEIRVLCFERAQCGTKTITTNLGVDAPTQFIVIDEETTIIIRVLVAHGTYCRETDFSVGTAAVRPRCAPVGNPNPRGR